MQGLNMKKEDLIKIIKKYLEKEDQKKVEKIDWDSLTHLNILMDLEKKLSLKISEIKKISEANSFDKLFKLLNKKK
jgi:acyl carrier protein|tara:strand:+ start:459 stop:686 length:228 start_codon:yes stop_codon:yes gene_type:complete